MKSTNYLYLLHYFDHNHNKSNDKRAQTKSTELKPLVDQFADLRVIRYTIPDLNSH